MTENKRFQYNVNKNTIEQNGKFVAYMNSVDGVRIANKLNVLQNENDELKKILGFLQNDNATDILNVLNSQENQIWELKKENEQLKSEINMLKITIGRNEGYIDRLTHKGEWR